MLCQPLRQTIVQSITVFLSFSSLRDVWFWDSVHKFSPQSTNQKIIMLYWHRCYWGVSNAWKIFAKKTRILKNPFCYYGTIARNTTTHFFFTITSAPFELKGKPVFPPHFFVFYYIFPLLEHNNIESPINNTLWKIHIVNKVQKKIGGLPCWAQYSYRKG